MFVSKIIELLNTYPSEFEIDVAVSNSKYVVMIPKHPNDVNNEIAGTTIIGNLGRKAQILKELEIINSVTPDITGNQDHLELFQNPHGEPQLLEVPKSLETLYQQLETINSQDLRCYNVLMVPMMYTDDNIKILKNFETFYQRYNDRILNREIIMPYLVETGSLFDNTEVTTIGKDSILDVEIGVKDAKNIDDFVEIYKRYFEQFPNVKHFKFNTNLEIGYITFDEEA